MRKLGGWGITALLSLGVVSLALAGEEVPVAKMPPEQGWLGRLFSRPAPRDELDQLFNAQDVKADKAVEAAKGQEERLKAESLKARDRFLRREMVLDRIQELATESGDKELSGKIEAMRERAWAVYLKRNERAGHRPPRMGEE